MNKTQHPFSRKNIILDDIKLDRELTEGEASYLASELCVINPWQTLGFKVEALSGYFVREDSALLRYKVIVNKDLAGIICIRYPWLRGPYIELIGLRREYQSLGLGGKLLCWVESEVSGYSSNVWVIASAFNAKAIQFYQKAGYQQICLLEGLVVSDKSEVLFRKQIATG